MSNAKLPDRPSLEYLKKRAKDRLAELRRKEPQTKLASALLEVAREHGFPSWRALKAEIEKRQAADVGQFFEACMSGDIETLRNLLANDPNLVRATKPEARFAGWTGLMAAAQHNQVAAVRLLLENGAAPDAREAGDNTTAMHWAAAKANVETSRALLDAGADVNGFGDLHELDVIGWATVFHEADAPWDVVPLLLERGAQHHIYSAIAMGDLDLIRRLVEENPQTLDRRMSRFEMRQPPLHFAMQRKRYDILDLLIDLGADLEAENASGQTPMAVAMLRGDQEAMRLLHAAGAQQPPKLDSSSFLERMAKLAASTKKGVPSISVPDIGAALEWYKSIGFREAGRWEEEGVVNWGMVAFGEAEIGFGMRGNAEPKDASIWLYTDHVDALYQLLRARQLELAEGELAGKTSSRAGIEFVEDLYDPFYGGRQFSIRDLNGYGLIFYQLSAGAP